MLYLSITLDSTAKITATYNFSCFGGYDTGWWDPCDMALKLTFVEQGDWEISINDQSLTASPGQMEILPPATVFKAIASNNITHSHCSIYMSNIRQFEFLTEDEFRNHAVIYSNYRQHFTDSDEFKILIPVIIDLKAKENYVTMFREIIEEYRSNKLNAKQGATYMLLNMLISLSRTHIDEMIAAKYANYKSTTKMVNNTIMYINSNYDRIDTVKEISEHVNYNPNYLGTIFKKRIGISINDYLNRLRVEKAKQLICSEDLTIKEISERVGMNDIYYFSKIFKKYTYMTARQYAKMFPK